MKQFFGLFMFLLGVFALGWLCLNLFSKQFSITRDPNPVLAVLGVALLHIGIQWIRGKPI
jgi:hypothetical protein